MLSTPSHAFDEQIGHWHVLPVSFVLQNLPQGQSLAGSNPSPQAFFTVAQVGSVQHHTQCPGSTMLQVWLLLRNVWPPHKLGGCAREDAHTILACTSCTERHSPHYTICKHSLVPTQGPSLIPTALLVTLSCPPVSISNSLLMPCGSFKETRQSP